MMRLIRSNSGFTLIELVMVIIILGIISGMAIMTFVNTLEDARFESTLAEMDALVAAIVGNANIYAKGGVSGWSLLPPPLSQPFYEGADGTGCPDPPWVIYGHVAGGGGGGATGDGGVAGPGSVRRRTSG